MYTSPVRPRTQQVSDSSIGITMRNNEPEVTEHVEHNVYSIPIRVFEAERRDESLSEAVGSLMQAATATKCGILVTRHRYDLYSAVVSSDVPHGLIREISQI